MAAGQKSGSESGGKKLLISILPSGVVPKSLRVRPGNQIAWFNGTSKECVVVFGTPTCPLEPTTGSANTPFPQEVRAKAFVCPALSCEGRKKSGISVCRSLQRTRSPQGHSQNYRQRVSPFNDARDRT